MVPLLVLLGTIAGAWYLLIVRPQQQQQTRHGALVSQLQIGDEVLTVGGIYGRVVQVTATAVDVELNGPGTTTRIATDAIAQIVQRGGGTIGAASASTDERTTVNHMQQHDPHQQHAPQPPTSGFVAPPLPQFAQPIYVAASAAPPAPQQQMAHAQPLAPQQPSAPAAFAQTTLRAHVVDHGSALPPLPVLKPWGDVAPRQVAPVVQPFASHPNAPAAPVSPGFQLAHQQHTAPVAPQYVAAPMAPPQYAMPTHAPQPVAHPQPQFQPQAHAPAQLHPQPNVHMATPVAMPAPHVGAPSYAHVAQPAAPQASPAPDESGMPGRRRRSVAPDGMGSSLRLDDPSLQDTMTRARNERSGLADEYRRAIAPMVDISVHAPEAVAGPTHHAAPAAPGALFAHAPQGADGTGAMPRPNIPTPGDGVDPALFARRTPMAHQIAMPEANGHAPSASTPAAAVATPA